MGLRLPHIAEAVATQPPVGWLEVHPENFLANPHAAELLADLAKSYPISLHTVGVSIGSASGIDHLHLKRIRHLAEATQPALISGHLAWSSYEQTFLNDLLPLPYTFEALRLVTERVHEIQDYLGQPYLVENPASYLGFSSSTMTETDFLSELVVRTGCKLLCDVSNVHISAQNMDLDACDYIDRLPADAIAEIHLGGYTPEADESIPGGELLIDTHAAPISDAAWQLYGYAIKRFGPRPTLIEWDNDLPRLAELVSETERAEDIAASAVENLDNAVAG